MANITTHDEAWDPDQAGEQALATGSTWDRIRDFLTGPYPTLISRLVLGSILLLAGITKLGVPETMRQSILAYEIPLPDFLVSAMSVGMPILEVGLGAWLLLGLFTRFSGAASAVFMAIFTIAITSAWLRGLDISCGCFGGAQANGLGLALLKALGPIGDYLANEKANLETILRDVVLTLMGVHLVFVPTIFSLDRLRQRAAEQEEE